MPNFIKPITKLTKEQAAALLERIIQRRATPKLTSQGMELPAGSRSLMGAEPTSERIFGQLRDTSVPEGAIGTRTLPIDEAMRTYMGDPDRYQPMPPGPPAKHLVPTPRGERGVGAPSIAESTNPQEILPASGIAMERMKFRNVQPSGTSQIMNRITEELAPRLDPLLNEGATRMKSNVPKKDILELSMALDDLWQTMGGGRSAEAKLWGRYLEGSRMKNKVKSAKDYFVSNALWYNRDPQSFKKMQPREAKLLESIYDIYQKETGVDLRTFKGE